MTATATRRSLNGVDVDRLFATIDAIGETPSLAAFEFRAQNQWIDGGRNRTAITDFTGTGTEHLHAESFVYENDEPDVLLGADRSANPVEFVLHALAGCLTTSLVYHAAARGIPIRRVETRLEGDLDLHGFLGMDDSVRNGYQQVRVTMRVDADGTEEDIAELVAMGRGRSPVFDIVSHPVPVDVRAEKA